MTSGTWGCSICEARKKSGRAARCSPRACWDPCGCWCGSDAWKCLPHQKSTELVGGHALRNEGRGYSADRAIHFDDAAPLCVTKALFRPFRACILAAFASQRVALGWHVLPLRGIGSRSRQGVATIRGGIAIIHPLTKEELAARVAELKAAGGDWSNDIRLSHGVWTLGNLGLPNTRLKRCIQVMTECLGGAIH